MLDKTQPAFKISENTHGQHVNGIAAYVACRKCFGRTFAGFSAYAMATVLPANGTVITMDTEEKYWQLIGKNFSQKAGVSHKIDTRLSVPADITLSKLIDEGFSEMCDLCYIDADKLSYDVYYELCLKLVRPFGIIAMDNVLWDGLVSRNSYGIAYNRILQNFLKLNKKVAADERVWTNILALGDGLTICVKRP